MDFDPTHLDRGFMVVDADTRYGDVLDLMGNLSPSRVVIRETPDLGDHDDENDIYYIVDAGLLRVLGASHTTQIGELALMADMAPAAIFDELHIGRGLIHGLATRHAPPAAGAHAVVLSEGIPTGVIAPSRLATPAASPPTGPSPAADGDPGPERPLGLLVDYPKSVAIDTTMSLLIRLTDLVSGADVLPFVGATGDVIDVFVSARSGFVADGAPDGQLVVTAEAEALPILIKLRATTLGSATVTVYAFRRGAALGALTITPEVVAADVPEALVDGVNVQALEQLGDDAPADADLQLVILQERNEFNQPSLMFRLTSREPSLGLNLKAFGPIVLENGPSGYFSDLYRDIEKLPVKTPEQKAAAASRLEAIGSTLFNDLLPDDLKALLWELRERVKTVWIQSGEPFVPWELCRLHGRDADGAIVEGGFFCEAFALTRWLPGVPRRPDLRLSSIGLIVPGDSGLTSPPAEKKMLHALAGPGRTVADITPKYVKVREALASQDYDGLHFSGHGRFPNQANPAKAEIELEDKGVLRPDDIGGITANFGLRNPLVFLNACQIGRQAPGLTGVGGWATVLLNSGAAAFIGAHWEVDDDLALTFATTFYQRLVAGDTIATATRAARTAIRAAGDPTWLAYTVFADPGARLIADDVP